MKSIIDDLKQPVLLLGNGLNRLADSYRDENEASDVSWQSIIECIVNSFFPHNTIDIGEITHENGVSFPEVWTCLGFLMQEPTSFHDAATRFAEQSGAPAVKKLTSILLHSEIESSFDKWLKQDIAMRLSKYDPLPTVHGSFSDFIHSRGLPILTTNFDHALEKAMWTDKSYATRGMGERGLRELQKRNRKYFYSTYISSMDIGWESIRFKPSIWHIHGDANEPQTMRLSSHDYALLLRNFQDNALGLADGENWINLFMNGDLVIVGLGLDYHEYPLRWLLTERMKRNGTDRTLYMSRKGSINSGKRFFLNSIGVEIQDHFNTYEELYKQFGVQLRTRT